MRVYERLLHAEGRSSLYPERDSLDRLREVERGVIAPPEGLRRPASSEGELAVS